MSADPQVSSVAIPGVPNTEFVIEVAPDDPSGDPTVVMKMRSGAIEVACRVDARTFPQFVPQLASGLMQAGQAAISQKGPQLITPTSGLFLPNGAVPR